MFEIFTELKKDAIKYRTIKIGVIRDAIIHTNESTHASQLSHRKIFQNGSILMYINHKISYHLYKLSYHH